MATLRAIPRWAVDMIRIAVVLAVGLTVFSVYAARGDQHDQTFYACLYAGSLSQVNTSGPPANCGRGNQVSWNSEGIQGLPGIDGVDGVSGYERIVATIPGTVQPFGIAASSVSCPEEKVVLGGGAFIGNSSSLRMIESFPVDDTSWSVAMINIGETEGTFIVYATCAFMAPDDPA